MSIHSIPEVAPQSDSGSSSVAMEQSSILGNAGSWLVQNEMR